MRKENNIFVLSDIHGCLKELQILIEQLPLNNKSILVFLGDYIDRGEDSNGVLDYIIKLKRKYIVIALMGNHEKMFLDYLTNKNSIEASSFVFN